MNDREMVIVGTGGTVSNELSAPRGHTTRALAFDANGRWLYVSISSNGNVNIDSPQSCIHRFDVSAWHSAGSESGERQTLNFNNGEVFADGLRNKVGLAFDSHGNLGG